MHNLLTIMSPTRAVVSYTQWTYSDTASPSKVHVYMVVCSVGMYNDTHPHLQYHTEHFTALKSPVLRIITPPPSLTPDNHWFLTVSVVSLLQKGIGLEPHSFVVFQTGFFHFTICIYDSFMYFQGLLAHLFLPLSNIPLSGWTTVCASIHLLKDVLAAWRFWPLWISCYKHLCACWLWT